MSQAFSTAVCCFLVVLCACAHRNTGPSRTSPTTAAPPSAPPAGAGDEATLRAVARGEGAPEELAPEPTAAASTSESPACTLPALSALSSADFIAQHGTQIERYQIEGGAWLTQAPVLVNQDYDFTAAREGSERPQAEWTMEGTLMLETFRLVARVPDVAAFPRCEAAVTAR